MIENKQWPQHSQKKKNILKRPPLENEPSQWKSRAPTNLTKRRDRVSIFNHTFDPSAPSRSKAKSRIYRCKKIPVRLQFGLLQSYTVYFFNHVNSLYSKTSKFLVNNNTRPSLHIPLFQIGTQHCCQKPSEVPSVCNQSISTV